ncbi:unnamed protein product [Mytilus edulis]|uniref:Uncharacterized protein n=1 Tax=Mytilus edulis TaxID=6550 RepID=A0A8S3VB75_MYTED|nr:unnamed protein product [Mytilus edulis]
MGSCSKSCDYGGVKTRFRTQAISQKGRGKFCTGNAIEYYSCFNKCCLRSYNCLKTRNVYPKRRYVIMIMIVEIGKMKKMQKSCSIKYTSWNNAGRGNAAYLDRHHLYCHGNGILNMFELERSGNEIRYKYRCCDVFIRPYNQHKFSTRETTNSFTYDGSQNTVYLDRQYITCSGYGLLQSMKLVRNAGHTSWRYEYVCKHVLGDYGLRLGCYEYSTGFTKDGDGQNYYLDRQHVSCPHDHFMQYIHLNRNSDHTRIRYTIRCCEIIVP